MKYIKNPITYQFIKNKFIENNIPINRESLFYFSNPKQLLIEKTIFQSFYENTNILNDLVLELIEDFKKGSYFEYYNFSDIIKNIIFNSLQKESLAFRFDWGLENNQPKLFEINAESCGFMTECSLIPRWLEKEYSMKTFDFDFYENYTQQILKSIKKGKLYLGSLNYIYDIQNLYWIKHFLKKENLDVEIIDLNHLQEKNNAFYIDEEKIINFHKIYPWEWIIEDGNLLNFQSLNITEPIWTTLFNSKLILYLLYNKHKKYSIFLETYYNEKVVGKFIEKNFNSMQGSSVIKSNGNKKWNDSILQKKINPIKIENDIIVFNTWIINHKFSGIGVKIDNKLISNAQHKFVPLSIEN